MTHLVFILISLALLVGFFVLTNYEARHGRRVLALKRKDFDRHIERIEFIIRHVNLSAFLRDEARRVATRLGHDSAHLSLLVVRAVERLLTRLVRHLRTRSTLDTTPPRESMREFVKTLSDFKGHLEATRPVREQELGESS